MLSRCNIQDVAKRNTCYLHTENCEADLHLPVESLGFEWSGIPAQPRPLHTRQGPKESPCMHLESDRKCPFPP